MGDRQCPPVTVELDYTCLLCLIVFVVDFYRVRDRVYPFVVFDCRLPSKGDKRSRS